MREAVVTNALFVPHVVQASLHEGVARAGAAPGDEPVDAGDADEPSGPPRCVVAAPHPSHRAACAPWESECYALTTAVARRRLALTPGARRVRSMLSDPFLRETVAPVAGLTPPERGDASRPSPTRHGLGAVQLGRSDTLSRDGSTAVLMRAVSRSTEPSGAGQVRQA